MAGRTGPNPALRFGCEDDPLDRRGVEDIRRLMVTNPSLAQAFSIDTTRVPPVCATRLISGPEGSVVETARTLGAEPTVDGDLRSINLGRWTGKRPDEIALSELGRWRADPTAAPHGGESIATFVRRVGVWLATATLSGGDVVAVVASPVAQAIRTCVAGGEPAAYFTTDVRPATVFAA